MTRAIAIAAVVASMTSAAMATTVVVRVQNVANADGTVRVSVCTSSEFLKDCAIGAHAKAQAGAVDVEVPNVPSGVYAVVAFHDADDDHQVGQNFLGIPTEGVGFSRDPSMSFGAPRFDGAALRIEGPRVLVPITLHFE